MTNPLGLAEGALGTGLAADLAAESTTATAIVRAGRVATGLGAAADQGACRFNYDKAACFAFVVGAAGLGLDLGGVAIGGTAGFGMSTFGTVSLGGTAGVVDTVNGIKSIQHLCHVDGNDK